MRLIPMITAVLVAVFLYGIVLQRETVIEFARDLRPSKSETEDGADMPSAKSAENSADADEGPLTVPAPVPTGVVAVFARHSVASEVDSGILIRGETEALRQVEVQAETNGRVISEPLRRGSFVEAGQMLCEIDPGDRMANLAETQARLAEAMAQRPEVEARPAEAEARLQEARARLEEALINSNAAQRLSQDGYASDTRVAATEAGVRSAEAAVSSAEAGVKSAQGGLDSLEAAIQSASAAVARTQTDLNRLIITAPFSGLLETDTAELGSLLQGGGAGSALCATIIQLDPIKLVGYVPETDVSRIKQGATAGAKLTGGVQVVGEVDFISRSADALTRTFRVEVQVPNPNLDIRDGQTVEIAIRAAGEMAHLLPQSSLTLNDQGVLGVRTVTEDSKALFMPVTLLRDTRQGVLVTGLPTEVDVIIVGQEYVIDGVSVAPTFEEVTQ